MTRTHVWITLLALPACASSHQVLDGEEYTCGCSDEVVIPLPSITCDPMSCPVGVTGGTIHTSRTINACSTVRDPEGTGEIAHSICATACGGGTATVTSAVDLSENPTCDTHIDPILFPITPSTALRVGHVVPERSTVTVTVNGVASPPIQPIPTEITVTGNPPLPGHPVNQCMHGEHFDSCSIGFSRGTIELPAFTITDHTPDNTLAVPLLQFEINPDPSTTTPGWNGFWAGGGTADHETYRIDSPDVTAIASTDHQIVMGSVGGSGFDDEMSVSLTWSDLSGEVNLRPNLEDVINHHLTIEGVEHGVVTDYDIPFSVELHVYVEFLEGRPLAIMGRSTDPSSHALVLDGRATFDHTGAPVDRYIWMISPTGTATGAFEIATGPVAVVPDGYWRAVVATHPGMLCLLAQDGALFYDITCVDPGVPAPPGSPGIVPPVSGILASMPYESRFYRMIGIAGLAQQLDKPGPQTIFAPSDDALAALPPDKLARLLDAQHAAETRAFVLGHVFPATVPQKSVAQMLGTLKPESGGQLALTPAQVAAAIIHGDLYATGGVVHLVRTPLVK